MAIQLKSTKDFHQNGVKLIVYGASGAGKTSLIKTLPNPIIISAESGLLSITDSDIPYIEVTTMEELSEAYDYVIKSDYESIALDSISEIAEVILSNEKRKSKDPRQAYGAMQDIVADLIRSFRDISGKNVYFSAKLEKSQDETGRILYSPSMPGNKSGQALPYWMDEVLALRVEKDADGKTQRALMCDTDGIWTAKDRSGKLGQWMPADLSEVINKIKGGK
jgi:phage nucleotide-binding protein